jgi:hypothetical protein
MICAFSISAAEPGPQSASMETGARESIRPGFSWDTVPRATSVHKPTAWTDDEYSRIARYDFLQTNYKNEAMAIQVKEFNPAITIVGYKNLVVHYEGTKDPMVQEHPDWFLQTDGKPELHGRGRNKHPLYDLRRPEVREYWVREADRILRIPVFDGIFIDGYAKVMGYGAVERATGQSPPADYRAGYRLLMEEHVKRSAGLGKIRIGNYLRANFADAAVPEVLNNLDGSYLEWFDHYVKLADHLRSYEEYLAAGIQAVQQVAQAGKVIMLRLKAEDDRDVKVTEDEADPEAPGNITGLYKNFEYKLAIFLICAERYSYFAYQGSPKVTKDVQLWAPDFAEFHKPLGPPKGPAVRDGFRYTREFQHARVWLDLSQREGRITWTASYPEVTALSPRHGDNAVSAGSLPCLITFDRPVTKATGTIGLYRLRDRKLLASVPVESDAVTSPDEKSVAVSFPIATEPKTEYSIVVSKGSLHDRDGMIFLGMPVLGQWKFVTR